MLTGNNPERLSHLDSQTFGYSASSLFATENSIRLNPAIGALHSADQWLNVFSRSGSSRSSSSKTVATRDPGNTAAAAQNLGSLSSVPLVLSDSVGWNDVNDYYRFSVASTQTVNLSLSGLTADADLQLLNASATVLNSSTRGGSNEEAINQQLAAGTYFVRVFRFSGDTPYTLKLSATDPSSPGNLLSIEADVGTLSQSPTRFSSTLDSRDLSDVVRFNLDSTSTLNLSVTGLRSNADVRLIRDSNTNGIVDNGEEIARSQRTGTTEEFISLNGLAAGTYLVQIYQTTAVSNTYSLQLSVLSEQSLTPAYSTAFGYGLVDANQALARVTGQSAFPGQPDRGGNDWSLDLTNAPEGWARGYTGHGVVVAVVDSGVDYSHPDLDANIWVNSGEIADNGMDDDGNGFVDDVRGWDFVNRDNTPLDGNGHGTHVAGTIAAENNGFGVTGVAYNARIMPIRVLNDRGSGSASAIAAGIRYATNNGADIINLSLGGSASQEIQAAIEEATRQGALVVMAAGNSGGAQPSAPANLANRWGVAVGAVDRAAALASFSNRAGTAPLNYVVAPGVNIYSTAPGNTYRTLSGTSMATPQVAGIAALMRSANPNLTPDQLVQALTTTANPRVVA